MARRTTKLPTLADGRYLAKCRQTTFASAVLNGHSLVWPEAELVILGEDAEFFIDGKRVWSCSMQYAANQFDVTLLQLAEDATGGALDVTKEGIKVVPGQVWKDLDKRQHGRRCQVVAVANGKAEMRFYSPGRLGTKSTVSIARMHKHSTGWVLERQPS